MSKNLDIRNYEELAQAIELAQHTVYKRYFEKLETYPLAAPTQILLDEKPENCLRFILLEELSSKKGEDIFQKLSTIYYASMALGCSLVMIVDVENNYAPAKIYLGVRNDDKDDKAKKLLQASFAALKNGIRSNFPGTKFRDISVKEMIGQNGSGSEEQESQSDGKRGILEEIFGEEAKYISSVSCVASIRDKSKTENKTFVQGLERFIEAMKGNAYTAVFIAEPVSVEAQHEIRNGYEILYSTLSPFRKSVWSYNQGESNSVMESLSKTVSKAVTEGTSHTQGHTVSVGMEVGINTSKSSGSTEGMSVQHTESKPTTASRVGNILSNPVTSTVLTAAGTAISAVFPPAAIIGMVAGAAAPIVGSALQGENISDSIAKSISNTVEQSLGVSGGLNAGYSKMTSDTVLHNETEGRADTETEGTTDTESTGRTLQTEIENKSIEEMLTQIEEQLKRIKEGEDYGAYNVGAYFLAPKRDSSILASTTYRSLMIGDGSSVESGAINFWGGNGEANRAIVTSIKQYLCRAVHPIFVVPMKEDEEFITYTPGTMVSGLELPLHIGLPTKSVYGLPVLEYAEFGRNVVNRAKTAELDRPNGIVLGKIYHMGQEELGAEVKLDGKILPQHTFITGSTGSGKSNTVYQLLKELNKQKVHFLVIEPAKGEYKHVFGNNDAKVYGTNPYLTPLLKINPFRFPKEIHVLEHIDRLVELFNVCWPMYAAMPAVLKDSVERGYKNAGWDLVTSHNKYSDKLFPTFVDILKELNHVVEESAFSQEVKDNYIGALSTRVKSLTNGIYGRIFDNDELGDEKLFDENVIVDLSRVGSVESKSMIMGILVMRLQEYRMTSGAMNAELKHVTVLEEAHNLLKRTSTEQSGESANLLGKSVEMLSNAIAEVRTYGEGFIIADQAPGLLDMSVIRNTNTKIIMRLPDAEDRNLVGKSANLSEEQVKELAKIPTGVAAVYQNSWLEPVLCKVKYEKTEENYLTNSEAFVGTQKGDALVIIKLLNKVAGEQLDMNMDELINIVILSSIPTTVKADVIRTLRRNGNVELNEISSIIYEMVSTPELDIEADKAESIEDWKNTFVYADESIIADLTEEQQNQVVECILREQIARYNKPNEYLETWYKYTKGEVV